MRVFALLLLVMTAPALAAGIDLPKAGDILVELPERWTKIQVKNLKFGLNKYTNGQVQLLKNHRALIFINDKYQDKLGYKQLELFFEPKGAGFQLVGSLMKCTADKAKYCGVDGTAKLIGHAHQTRFQYKQRVPKAHIRGEAYDRTLIKHVYQTEMDADGIPVYGIDLMAGSKPRFVSRLEVRNWQKVAAVLEIVRWEDHVAEVNQLVQVADSVEAFARSKKRAEMLVRLRRWPRQLPKGWELPVGETTEQLQDVIKASAGKGVEVAVNEAIATKDVKAALIAWLSALNLYAKTEMPPYIVAARANLVALLAEKQKAAYAEQRYVTSGIYNQIVQKLEGKFTPGDWAERWSSADKARQKLLATISNIVPPLKGSDEVIELAKPAYTAVVSPNLSIALGLTGNLAENVDQLLTMVPGGVGNASKVKRIRFKRSPTYGLKSTIKTQQMPVVQTVEKLVPNPEYETWFYRVSRAKEKVQSLGGDGRILTEEEIRMQAAKARMTGREEKSFELRAAELNLQTLAGQEPPYQLAELVKQKTTIKQSIQTWRNPLPTVLTINTRPVISVNVQADAATLLGTRKKHAGNDAANIAAVDEHLSGVDASKIVRQAIDQQVVVDLQKAVQDWTTAKRERIVSSTKWSTVDQQIEEELLTWLFTPKQAKSLWSRVFKAPLDRGRVASE